MTQSLERDGLDQFQVPTDGMLPHPVDRTIEIEVEFRVFTPEPWHTVD